MSLPIKGQKTFSSNCFKLFFLKSRTVLKLIPKVHNQICWIRFRVNYRSNIIQPNRIEFNQNKVIQVYPSYSINPT